MFSNLVWDSRKLQGWALTDRTDSIDLWFRNGHDVRQAKADIDADVADLCRLCDNLSNPEGFKHEETKTYG